MHISRFQLKLTLIFLILLLIPAIIATFFTRSIPILTEWITGIDADKGMEAVLQEATEMAYDIIEEAEAECQSVAEQIAADEELLALMPGPHEKLGDLLTEIMPTGGHLSAMILDFRTEKDSGHKTQDSRQEARDSLESGVQSLESYILFRTSTSTASMPYSIVDSLKQDRVPFSYQEGGIIYGIAPILQGDSLVGAVVVHQRLKQDVIANIDNLQKLLRVYALRPELNRLIWIGVIVLVVVLAVAGAVLAAILARSVTRPILSLVAGTREIAQGNLDHRVQVKGKDEIATLEDSFNSMAAKLKTSIERQARAERLAAWRDVARRIAHEIKNPLTPIQLSMYRLRKNLGSERYGEVFQQSYTSITNEVENLRNMVTEFSDFARMPKPRKSPASPNEIVQDAINLYTGLPENIEIRTELADNLPQVMADVDQMRQVLHNLIGNAVDAMSDGGQLSVTTSLEADDTIAIEISDTGCGMSEEVKQKLFTPYFTTKETGTGLGMAITAQIIEEHEGEISVDSQEGIGTTVTVRLKAAMDSEAVAENQT